MQPKSNASVFRVKNKDKNFVYSLLLPRKGALSLCHGSQDLNRGHGASGGNHPPLFLPFSTAQILTLVRSNYTRKHFRSGFKPDSFVSLSLANQAINVQQLKGFIICRLRLSCRSGQMLSRQS